MNFSIGQWVRVTAVRSLAYGRIAMVVAGGKSRVQVRFADLPQQVEEPLDPQGLVETFAHAELSLLEDVPPAAFYLVVTIAERNREQHYRHLCLAHGTGQQTPADVAEAIAQTWYPSGGDWDDSENGYVFSSDGWLTAVVEGFQLISAADYINLRMLLADCSVDNG